LMIDTTDQRQTTRLERRRLINVLSDSPMTHPDRSRPTLSRYRPKTLAQKCRVLMLCARVCRRRALTDLHRNRPFG
jgi:hypothetical protein